MTHQNLKGIYLLLCIIGTILPYSQFVPWLLSNGVDLPLFFEQLFANRISTFFGMDVMVSAVVLLVFILSEGARIRLRQSWLPVASTFFVGVSLGLPLFLYLREVELEKRGG